MFRQNMVIIRVPTGKKRQICTQLYQTTTTTTTTTTKCTILLYIFFIIEILQLQHVSTLFGLSSGCTHQLYI